jgi:hypothetical protein
MKDTELVTPYDLVENHANKIHYTVCPFTPQIILC